MHLSLYSPNLLILWNTYACLHYSQNKKVNENLVDLILLSLGF